MILRLSLDATGNLFVADGGTAQRIWRVDTEGTVHPYAGTGEAGTDGNDGPALAARLDGPNDILVSPDGVLYVASDGEPCIRAIGADEVIRSIWCRPA